MAFGGGMRLLELAQLAAAVRSRLRPG
jgi:hypothetical protein